jgi:hypothetical protein
MRPLLFLGVACFSLLALLTSGCRSTPAPLEMPRAELEIEHFAGTMLSGPIAAERASIDFKDAALVRVEVTLLERMPADRFPAVVDRAICLAETRGGDPFVSTSELLAKACGVPPESADALTARVAAGDCGQTHVLATLDGVVARGVVSRVTAYGAGDPDSDGAVRELSWACEWPREANAPRVVLAARGVAREAGRSSDARDEEVAVASAERHELALLPDAFRPGDPARLFLAPCPFTSRSTEALLVRIELAPADPAALENVLPKAREQIAAASRSRWDGARATARDELAGQERERALSALARSSDRRASLLFLAQGSGAEFAADFALAVDDATLADVVRALDPQSPSSRALASQGASLGFVIERTAYARAVAVHEEAQPSLALRGILARHTGVVARSPGLMEEILSACRDLAALRARLVEENRDALEDGDPVQRVRGFDWLAARSLAPAGYDPLAPATERRKALTRAEEAAQKPADASGSGSGAPR